MKIAVYPGSFNPITNGHIDILKRALKVFDQVIILVATNPEKKYAFTMEERVEMIRGAVKDFKNVSVDSTDGLTVRYAEEHNATHIIRGLRAVTDFEYEFQLADANHFVDPNIDSVFFMSNNDKSFISSSTIIQMYKSGVEVNKLVPDSVLKKLKEKFN